MDRRSIRKPLLRRVCCALRQLAGARQTGKTSLMRRLFSDHAFVTLDLPSEAEQAESPRLFLAVSAWFSALAASRQPMMLEPWFGKGEPVLPVRQAIPVDGRRPRPVAAPRGLRGCRRADARRPRRPTGKAAERTVRPRTMRAIRRP